MRIVVTRLKVRCNLTEESPALSYWLYRRPMAHNSLRFTVAIPLREMYATYCEPSGSGIIGLYSGNFTNFE